MMTIRLAMVMGGLLGAASASAACVAESPATRQKVIELYTAEGCSSCPPADHWMSLIKPHAAIALAFHVDYWDSQGWRDRFDSPRYTARQRDLLGRGGKTIYTPEVALNGREWREWSSGVAPHDAAAGAVPALSLQVQPGNPLQLQLTTAAGALGDDKAWRAYFAVTEDDLHSAVNAGENRGKQLQHDHVVRAFGGPYALDQANARLDLPGNLKTEHATVVAFVQNSQTGEIAQAVQQPLQACALN